MSCYFGYGLFLPGGGLRAGSRSGGLSSREGTRFFPCLSIRFDNGLGLVGFMLIQSLTVKIAQ